MAYNIYHKRVARIRGEREATNNSYVDRRLASLERYYGNLISGLESQIVKAKAEGGKEKYIQLTEGRLNKTQKALETKIEEENSKRIISEETDEVAAGILEIRNGTG